MDQKMILEQNPACVCVCAYHGSTRWRVVSHPGPEEFWTGSQLPHTQSSPAAGAAAQRTELPASPPSVSWDKHSPSNLYTYATALTQTCSPHNSHTPHHSTHPHNEANTGGQAGSLFHRAEETWKKKHTKPTALAVMIQNAVHVGTVPETVTTQKVKRTS